MDFSLLSLGGISDSIVATLIIAISGFFLRYLRNLYNNHKVSIELKHKDIEHYLSSTQKVAVRRDFTYMLSFYINNIKHQQLTGYFLLTFYLIFMLIVLFTSLLIDATPYKNVYIILIVLVFFYFFWLRHLTDVLINQIESKCVEQYMELIPSSAENMPNKQIN